MAKTKFEKNPPPRSFLVKSLLKFVGDLPEERLRFPVRAARTYLDTTAPLAPHPRSLFLLVALRGPFQRMPFPTFSVKLFLVLEPYRVIRLSSVELIALER